MRAPAAHVDLSVPRVPPRTYGIEEMAETFVEVDARVSGPFEFHEATAPGAEVSEVFVTSTGQRVHFQLTPRMPAREMQSEVRVVFRSATRDPPIVAVAPFRVRADRTLSIPSGESTSLGGIYSGPVLHCGQILFGTDPLVHLGAYTSDPDRRQGSPERASFRRVGFHTWLDAKVAGEVEVAPVVIVAAGSVDVQYAVGREARLVYDPRDARGRLIPGRHALTVRWWVQLKASRADFGDTIHVRVSDDGTIAVGD